MKYKILVKISNGNTGIGYFKFYQVSPAEGDWESTDQEETKAKIKELLEEYSLSEMKLVINVDTDITIDIPALPVEKDEEPEEEPKEDEPTEDNQETA